MKTKRLDYIDFEKVNTLLEAFNKTTGYVTAILDLEGNILSRSGWRQICTDFHRVNPETAKKCTLSDTVLAGKMAKGEKYHVYKCLNGLVDVAVPVVVNGEHIANLFSGQFFFEKPDLSFFKKQAVKYGFDEKGYLEAFEKVPVVSLEEVKTAMDFLLEMTRIISEMTFQRQELIELNKSICEREDALRESERRFSDMLRKVDLISITLDRDAKITFCNDYLLQLTGWSQEEVIGKNWFKMFVPAEDKKLKRTFSAVLQDEPAAWHYENRIVTREGEYLTIHWNNTVLRSPAGEVIGTASIGEDITERKLAEEKLRENNSLLRIAAEKARLGGWNVNLKENRCYWSDEVAMMHEMPAGYAPLVEDGISFYAPEWHDRISRVFANCAKKGIPYDEEMEIITSSGKRKWVRTIGEAVRDEKGKIFKVQGAFQDITERKAEEERIREKDLQFRKLSANVPDLIFQFTRKPDGTYCVPVASEGIRNIFGCSPEDVLNDFSPIARVIYPEDAERVIRDIEYSAENLTYFTCEFRVQIPGRPVQWIFSRSSPERLQDGSVTWYGFNADITYRKIADEAIRNLNSELEKRVIERTAQLEAANKELEAFSYSVSHDLRAPLRHINGYAEILTQQFSDDLTEEARRYLNTIVGSAQRMGTLIDDLLSFSRTGRAELSKSSFNMNQVVNDALSQIKASHPNRKIDWKISPLPGIHGDYSLLRLVWLNLLDNAVKYTKDKKKSVIRVGYKDLEKEYVFTVKDNGVGFDMKYAQKLFGVFQRLHSSSEFEGTGIGLANVQRIILRHGGRTWAEAKPDKGAVFYFSIPKETDDR